MDPTRLTRRAYEGQAVAGQWHGRADDRTHDARPGARGVAVLAMARGGGPMSHAVVIAFAYGFAIACGVLLADDAALRDTRRR